MTTASANRSDTTSFRGADGLAHRIRDVSDHDYGGDIDFERLDIIRTAPAQLTSAERLLLYSLVFALRPERYLEVGIRFGGASLIVARAMDAASHDGRLILIDRAPEMAPEHWEQIAHRSTLIEGFSPQVLPKARTDAGQPFDMVFIDAKHSADAVLKDAEGVFPYLADGAYVLFHDSFSAKVSSAITLLASRHAHELVDFGLLTRDYTRTTSDNGVRQLWCGFRLFQLRRGYRRWSPASLAGHWYKRLWYRSGSPLHHQIKNRLFKGRRA